MSEALSEIEYRFGNDLDLDQMIELYRASTLGERRPVDSRERMQKMLEHGNLTITAWEGDLLVGIARTLTDFAFVAYVSDLAVRKSHQRKGIGRVLLRMTRDAIHEDAFLTLLAAPASVDYYPHIGMKRHPEAWMLGPKENV